MTSQIRTPATLGAPLMLSPRMAAGSALINSAPPPLISAGDAGLMYAPYQPDFAAQYAAAQLAQAQPPPMPLADYTTELAGGFFAR